MANNEQERAQRLFRALGEIDDRLISEAITAQKVPPKRRRSRHTVLTAAASILLAVSLGALGGKALQKVRKKLAQSPSNSKVEATADLSELLLACTQSQAFTKQATLAVPADGLAYLLVGARDGDRLWISRPLDQQEKATVSAELYAASQQNDFASPISDPYLIWYTDGNGNVWSPCLTGNAGNVTFGCVYDYQSERAPSTAFCQLLSELIG